jgi:hypothetical protein
MESLEMKYHYQAKTAIFAYYTISQEDLDTRIVAPLKTEDKVMVKCEIKLFDAMKNHVATGYTNWQIKPWSKVKTKL